MGLLQVHPVVSHQLSGTFAVLRLQLKKRKGYVPAARAQSRPVAQDRSVVVMA